MAHKPRKTAGFVTVCCSMSMVSKTLCSHFSSQGSYYGYTHAWTKFHNEVMSWTSGAYECHYAWSAVAFSRSISVELDSERSIMSTLHERALAHVQIWNVRIYPFVEFKFSVYAHTYVRKQTPRRTHVSCNAVPLVRGSPRLVPNYKIVIEGS